MKWGRNKLHSSESSSSRNSFISHVIPVSWLSKFKQKIGDVEAKPVKRKQEGQRNSTFVASPKYIGGRGRFYSGGEGDTFWRLSFGDEGDQGNTTRGDLRPVWDGSSDKLHVPPSNSGTTLVGNEDTRKFNNLLMDARKTKEWQRNVGTSPEMDVFKNEEEGIDRKTLKVTTTKEQKSKKTNLRVPKDTRSKPDSYPDETEGKSRKSLEKKDSEFEMLPTMERQKCKIIRADMKKHGYIPSTNSTTFKEDDVQPFQTFKGISAGKVSSEWERLKEKKIKEVKSKNETHRKSLYISRELQTRKTNQNSKLKVGGSPRIKALEDMKKAKLKMKKGKEKTLKGTSLESFAVVKCSFEPQKDFRDSMIEMILEKRLSQPEELEELLACYLTLNSDEYHDLIIKVFRQVWSDLNQASFHQLHDEKYFHYY